jgi:hypothetical protein
MYGMLCNYIKNNPISKRVSFGEDKPEGALKTQITAPSDLHYGAAVTALMKDRGSVIILANGPEITDDKITTICKFCPEQEKFK